MCTKIAIVSSQVNSQELTIGTISGFTVAVIPSATFSSASLIPDSVPFCLAPITKLPSSAFVAFFKPFVFAVTFATAS